MSSRDAEITAITSAINELLDDLNATVAELNSILTGSVPMTGSEDDHERQR